MRSPKSDAARSPDARQYRSKTYSRKAGQSIAARIARGETWATICNANEIVTFEVVRAWRRMEPEFEAMLAEAQEAAADWCAHRALDVALAAQKETLTRDRLVVMTLMKHAAVLAPERWGGKRSTKPQVKPLALRVRTFEQVVRGDGKIVTRETFPDGTYDEYES